MDFSTNLIISNLIFSCVQGGTVPGRMKSSLCRVRIAGLYWTLAYPDPLDNLFLSGL